MNKLEQQMKEQITKWQNEAQRLSGIITEMQQMLGERDTAIAAHKAYIKALEAKFTELQQENSTITAKLDAKSNEDKEETSDNGE